MFVEATISDTKTNVPVGKTLLFKKRSKNNRAYLHLTDDCMTVKMKIKCHIRGGVFSLLCLCCTSDLVGFFTQQICLSGGWVNRYEYQVITPSVTFHRCFWRLPGGSYPHKVKKNQEVNEQQQPPNRTRTNYNRQSEVQKNIDNEPTLLSGPLHQEVGIRQEASV